MKKNSTETEPKNVMSVDAIGKAEGKKNGSEGGSDDEEVFKDVDRVLEEKKATATAERKQFNAKYSTTKQYDPLKREPKFANAENSPLWELASLAHHCHPTVCLWAERLLSGDLIDYAGDPLLDFGLANFLDRVSYKTPKTAEKAEKFRKRMAQYEKPVNMYNFREGDEPETMREEEKFLYKYMQMKAPSAKRDKKSVELDGEDEDEDPEMEAFVTEQMEKEMKKMAGVGADESDDGEDIEYSDAEPEEAGDSAAEEGDSDEGFFSGEEDLQDVELSQGEENDAEEGSEELGEQEGSYGAEGDEYDSQVGSEEDGEGLLPSEDTGTKGANKKEKENQKGRFKSKSGTTFASYEEFAHLLDEGLDEVNEK